MGEVDCIGDFQVNDFVWTSPDEIVAGVTDGTTYLYSEAQACDLRARRTSSFKTLVLGNMMP